jgi:asparagine synthase (glutamine-hydrolysing)
MCGIAGIVTLHDNRPPPGREPLERMLGALRHRGPDEFGMYRDRTAGLAHTRLSIIDLATGQQPMSDPDETLWIVFNGEIFNYVELREELVAAGHSFRTRSDTEVIVHAWQAWGEEAFTRFNGQWALALWDARRRRLVLSRDRLGIRPLYHAEHDGRLYFASEVKALFAAAPGLPRALDPVGMKQTLTFWSVVPPRSVFRGVSELEPGHVRTWDLGAGGGVRVSQRAYWTPRYRERGQERVARDLDEATRAVRDALERATALRMLRADVPVGSYLSGGLDSSLVAALGLAAKGQSFHTFSIRFEDAEYDETGFQRLMAARLGTEHHELVITRADIGRAFADVVRHTERPILRTAPAPLFALSRMVRDVGIKVVLTGEGADEVFAGYDIFREGAVRRFWARAPGSERRPRLLQKLYPYLARSPVQQQAMARHFFGRNLEHWRRPGFAHETRWHTTAALERLLAPAMRAEAAGTDVVAELLATLPEPFARWSPLAQDQYLEARTLLAGYILSSQGDRMLMAHSVEGRFPFLDRDVVELAGALPDAHKLRGLDEKHILKRAAADLVPREILRRKKQPYRAPDALAFVGAHVPAEVGDMLDAVLSEDAVRRAGVFDPAAATHLWQKCRARAESGQFSNTDNMALVAILSTQLLDHLLIREPYAAERPRVIRTLIERGFA